VNEGVRSVTTSVVVVMNDDIVASQSALDDLSRAVRNGADVAGPALVDGSGRVQRSIIALPTVAGVAGTVLLPDLPLPGLGWMSLPKWTLPSQPGAVAALTGAIFAVRTDLLCSIALPEDYFLYWEEAEWFWDLRL